MLTYPMCVPHIANMYFVFALRPSKKRARREKLNVKVALLLIIFFKFSQITFKHVRLAIKYSGQLHYSLACLSGSTSMICSRSNECVKFCTKKRKNSKAHVMGTQAQRNFFILTKQTSITSWYFP